MKNIFIFIGDSLRYDYFPRGLMKKGSVLRTAAQSLYTPPSIASIITGRDPRHHNVRTFLDILNPKIPTIFDHFKNGSYYDHPIDPMSKIVLRNCPSPKELSDIDEPFVWIERAMDTHIPYGRIGHGNFVEELTRNNGLIGTQYIKCLYDGTIDVIKEYQNGVNLLEKHFLSHIKELEERNILDDTLVIFTSDHGEVLGEFNRYAHGYPPCRELVLVPTLFWGYEFDTDFIRSIDIVPTSIDILRRRKFTSDGYSVKRITEKKNKIIRNEIYNVTSNNVTKWLYDKNDVLKLKKYYRYVKKLSFIKNKWVPIPIKVVYLNRLFSDIYTKMNWKDILL